MKSAEIKQNSQQQKKITRSKGKKETILSWKKIGRPVPYTEPGRIKKSEIRDWLVVTSIKGHWGVAALLSMLWFKNMKQVWTHIQIGLKSSDEDLSANSSGVDYVDRSKSRNKSREWWAVEIPLTEEMLSVVHEDFEDNRGRGYDFYVYLRRVLSVFLPLTLSWLIYSLFKWNLIALLVIGILYIPFNFILWWWSKKTWHCSEHVFTLITKLGIYLGYGKATQTDSDSIKYRFQVALENKSNKWQREMDEPHI